MSGVNAVCGAVRWSQGFDRNHSVESAFPILLLKFANFLERVAVQEPRRASKACFSNKSSAAVPPAPFRSRRSLRVWFYGLSRGT
jgi:hypothetical protein